MSFSPSDLSGYQIGLDADVDVFTDTGGSIPVAAAGDLVMRIDDQSGNGRHALQSGATGFRPEWARIAGRGALIFRGGASFLTTSSFFDSSYDTSCTFYQVVEGAITSNTIQVASHVPSSNFDNFFARDKTSGPTERGDEYTGALASGVGRYQNYSDLNAQIHVIRVNGTTKRLRIVGPTSDQSTDYTVSGNLGATGALSLGYHAGLGGFHWYGLIRGFFGYNTAHSDADVDAMVAYLQSRFLIAPSSGNRASGAGTSVVVCDGNSLVSGVGASTSYPSALASLLGTGWSVSNLGVPSKTTGEMNSDAEIRADALFDAAATRCVCVAWEATNDIFFGGELSCVKRRYRDYCLRRRAQGFEVIVMTVLPRTGSEPSNQETDRAAFNSWLRANYTDFADGVADVAADARLSDQTDGTYFASDQTHLVDAGYAVVAGIVKAAILGNNLVYGNLMTLGVGC